ncbi:MAG TPA: hypothetical protein PKJ33_03205 [Alphaproteobacteria bacterium]|nr:hypothetical protein [Alphaproteobacteria bacterium]
MKPFKKFLNVLHKNIEYTIVLVVAIILFALFSNGLFPGLITALSALVAYICVEKLYREFKKK